MSFAHTRQLMDKIYIRQWEHIERVGFWKFILLRGVLAWGVPVFLIMIFVFHQPQVKHVTASVVIFSACVWLLGGAGFGCWTWRRAKRKYEKAVVRQGRLET
jgi:formate-dependent nitrite reductase membrane component NrfD